MELKLLPHEIESLNIKLLSKRFFIVHFPPVVFKIPLLDKFAFIRFLMFCPSCNCTLYPENFITVFSIIVESEILCFVP